MEKKNLYKKVSFALAASFMISTLAGAEPLKVKAAEAEVSEIQVETVGGDAAVNCIAGSVEVMGRILKAEAGSTEAGSTEKSSETPKEGDTTEDGKPKENTSHQNILDDDHGRIEFWQWKRSTVHDLYSGEDSFSTNCDTTYGYKAFLFVPLDAANGFKPLNYALSIYDDNDHIYSANHRVYDRSYVLGSGHFTYKECYMNREKIPTEAFNAIASVRGRFNEDDTLYFKVDDDGYLPEGFLQSDQFFTSGTNGCLWIGRSNYGMGWGFGKTLLTEDQATYAESEVIHTSETVMSNMDVSIALSKPSFKTDKNDMSYKEIIKNSTVPMNDFNFMRNPKYSKDFSYLKLTSTTKQSQTGQRWEPMLALTHDEWSHEQIFDSGHNEADFHAYMVLRLNPYFAMVEYAKMAVSVPTIYSTFYNEKQRKAILENLNTIYDRHLYNYPGDKSKAWESIFQLTADHLNWGEDMESDAMLGTKGGYVYPIMCPDFYKGFNEGLVGLRPLMEINDKTDNSGLISSATAVSGSNAYHGYSQETISAILLYYIMENSFNNNWINLNTRDVSSQVGGGCVDYMAYKGTPHVFASIKGQGGDPVTGDGGKTVVSKDTLYIVGDGTYKDENGRPQRSEGIILPETSTIEIEEGGTVVVNGNFINRGTIINKGGTILVKNGGTIAPFLDGSEGTIKMCQGKNGNAAELLIMPEGKVYAMVQQSLYDRPQEDFAYKRPPVVVNYFEKNTQPNIYNGVSLDLTGGSGIVNYGTLVATSVREDDTSKIENRMNGIFMTGYTVTLKGTQMLFYDFKGKPDELLSKGYIQEINTDELWAEVSKAEEDFFKEAEEEMRIRIEYDPNFTSSLLQDRKEHLNMIYDCIFCAGIGVPGVGPYESTGDKAHVVNDKTATFIYPDDLIRPELIDVQVSEY